jgi:hypothetical protein
MSERDTAPSVEDLNLRLLAGAAVLVGIGSALGLAGVGLGAAALVAATRRWYQRKNLTPAQHAKLTWDQARAAASAGAGAWKGIDKNQYTKTAVDRLSG